ncbi:uncharacterized protein LOC125276261 [Megalobrama amblycephala]|uniref:uncharacterized protein LOC125276261 n=1 Tax=Megalobrama amblycephala TaxID=75352 RepID=UPI002013D032|nr:uncharacterized protein LOC125276261 [Megalobrama amblycephala]
MSSSSGPLTEELQCSICLDVFTDPVTTPCGHNFCKTCLNKCWDNSQTCNCPYCKETFKIRPDLKINTTLRELVDHYKKKSPEKKPEVVKKPEILCDFCEERKLKALKSCLGCQSSYCETHLEPHLRVAGLKKHKLINPVRNLEDYICQKHERPLELFCRDDQTCVCPMCAVKDHKNHNTVPIEEESEEKKTQLMKTQKDVQQMIQDRIKKIQDVKHSAEVRKRNTEEEKAAHVELFTDLIRSIERCQTELLEMMEEQQKAAEKQEEELIEELEQEITELKMRNTELEQLSHTEDHLHLLQIYSSLCSSRNTRNWSEISVKTDESLETLRRALTQLQDTVQEKLTLTDLKRMQQYEVDVTLDPDTANSELILSDDGKQVRLGDTEQDLPDKPERFDRYVNVLGKEGFSSGRFYFEVQVKGKTEWGLGVARESIDRKGESTLCPEDGYWTVQLRNGNEYEACDDSLIPLSLRVKPQRVGVFMDYEEGLVSFYDVESSSHIYSFTGQSFTDKLYPFFCPGLNNGGKNSTPLIITPVKYNKNTITDRSSSMSLRILPLATMREQMARLRALRALHQEGWEELEGLQILDFWGFVKYLHHRSKWATPGQPEPYRRDFPSLSQDPGLQNPTGRHRVRRKRKAKESAPAHESAPAPTEEMGTKLPPRPRKKRRRRKKASSIPQGPEAFPEPAVGPEAFPELAVGPETTPEVVLALPKRLALPAPPKCLALSPPLPRPSALLKSTWLVPPAPPWHSARTLTFLEPPWSVPPAPPWPSVLMPSHLLHARLYGSFLQLLHLLKISQHLFTLHQTPLGVPPDPGGILLQVDPDLFLFSALNPQVKLLITGTVCSVMRNTEKEKAARVELFTDLIRSIERCQTELLEMMEEQQKAAEKQEEELIEELEQEITELKMRNTELEQLSHTEDHLHLLQIYSSLCSSRNTRNWSEISVKTDESLETVRRALTQLQDTLQEKLTLTDLKRMQQYEVDVTLDPDTANPYLILSDDGKQVSQGDIEQKLPDKLERFDRYAILLGKEGFSSGRFYFEVQVKGKTDWTLGVARESIDRKGEFTLCPSNGLWTVWLRNENEYSACNDSPVSLCLRVKPQRVGVFVDYEEGLVSFYDVESSSHIYSYTGQSFTEKLYPYFSPEPNVGGKNSTPLIITPVKYNK